MQLRGKYEAAQGQPAMTLRRLPGHGNSTRGCMKHSLNVEYRK